ncbi:MAG: hypothetical protein ACJAWL_002161 [Motiliproteus sp.]
MKEEADVLVAIKKTIVEPSVYKVRILAIFMHTQKHKSLGLGLKLH